MRKEGKKKEEDTRVVDFNTLGVTGYFGFIVV